MSRVCSKCITVVIFTKTASGSSGTESLPDLDEFLASGFDPDIPDKEGDIGGQENAEV